jgi:hypothetical protein
MAGVGGAAVDFGRVGTATTYERKSVRHETPRYQLDTYRTRTRYRLLRGGRRFGRGSSGHASYSLRDDLHHIVVVISLAIVVSIRSFHHVLLGTSPLDDDRALAL